MKILICGGRTLTHDEKLVMRGSLNTLKESLQITDVVYGSSSGADFIAHKWAGENGFKSHVYRADYQRYGKSAASRRNTQMINDHPDIKMVHVFFADKGTQDMIRRARQAGIEVLVYE